MRDVKRCTGCGEVKPLDDYYRNRAKPDGRRSECKTCTAEAARRWREENRDKQLERHRRYYEENRDKERKRRRRYREENRDKKLESDRRYREENREYVNRRNQRRYRRMNGNTALTSTRKGKPWTPAEDDILTADDGRNLFAKAILLGRTYNSCACRSYRLARREVAA